MKHTDEELQTVILAKIDDFNAGGYDNAKMEDHLEFDLGLDSLDRVELLMKLEKDFTVLIPDEAWEEMSTVQSVFDIMRKYLD